MAEKRLLYLDSSRNRTFTGKIFIFTAFLFRFIFFTLCKMYSEIALLHFFEQSGIALIDVTDSIRAIWTRSLSATKIVSERHQHEHEQSMNMFIVYRSIWLEITYYNFGHSTNILNIRSRGSERVKHYLQV